MKSDGREWSSWLTVAQADAPPKIERLSSRQASRSWNSSHPEFSKYWESKWNEVLLKLTRVMLCSMCRLKESISNTMKLGASHKSCRYTSCKTLQTRRPCKCPKTPKLLKGPKGIRTWFHWRSNSSLAGSLLTLNWTTSIPKSIPIFKCQRKGTKVKSRTNPFTTLQIRRKNRKLQVIHRIKRTPKWSQWLLLRRGAKKRSRIYFQSTVSRKPGKWSKYSVIGSRRFDRKKWSKKSSLCQSIRCRYMSSNLAKKTEENLPLKSCWCALVGVR